MADDQKQPDEQDHLENETGPLANQPTSRPADNAPVAGASDAGSFEWGPSDEATDFLGLNDAVDPGAAGQPDAADPYAMPVQGQAEDASRTNWLLNEAAQPGQLQGAGGAPPGAAAGWDGQAGQSGENPNWLMNSQEPAPVPGSEPLPGSIQPAEPVGDPAAQGADPNWLLSLDEQKADQARRDLFAGGSQDAPSTEPPRGLDASFVDPEPPSRAVGRMVKRSLTAAALVAGGVVMWQVLSHQGDLDKPLSDPVEMDRTAMDRRTLEVPPGSTIDSGEQAGAGGRTAIAPDSRTEEPVGERRWYSNVAPQAPDVDAESIAEPSELDGDSYPWPEPTQQEVSDARSVLVAFDQLMGGVPLANAGPEASVETPPLVNEFDSLAVVVPDDTPLVLPEASGLDSTGEQPVGPPVVDPSGEDLPPVPRWSRLNQQLMSADRSVLDQYNSWRLSDGEMSAQRMDYAPRVGVRASIAPTLEFPFLVATIGVGDEFMHSGGPRPASGFEGLDRAGGFDPAASGDLLASEGPLMSIMDTIEAQGLDPRRIESDPLFSLQARRPGRDTETETLDNHWMGVNIPMHALDYPERVLTPRVGAVRVHHDHGEGFDGRLFAMGMGLVWVDTGIGRMALRGDSILRMERVDEDRAQALQDGAVAVAGLSRIRVTMAGGVFEGFELYREGDQVTMLTEKGYKLTLRSDDVELARRVRATAGIKRRGR